MGPSTSLRTCFGLRASGFGWLALAALSGLAFLACQTVDKVVKKTADTAAEAGVITEDTAKSVKTVSESFRKSAEDFTDEEEHYVGRSVAAQIFAAYRPVDREDLNAYVSRTGAAVALASDRPETFGGYRFQVLDTGEINAFAAPGGFIFVTRGMLALCEDEDMLAAVLAHEVAHVVRRHGLKTIKGSRLKAAFATLGAETARVLSRGEAEELAKTLHDSVNDIFGAMLREGYGKGAEEDADELAAVYLARAGYDPWALVRLLDAMGRHASVAKGGMYTTHPSAGERVSTVRETIDDRKLETATPAMGPRSARFRAAVGT